MRTPKLRRSSLGFACLCTPCSLVASKLKVKGIATMVYGIVTIVVWLTSFCGIIKCYSHIIEPYTLAAAWSNADLLKFCLQDSEKYVEELLTLFNRFSKLVKDAFNDDPRFLTARDKVCLSKNLCCHKRTLDSGYNILYNNQMNLSPLIGQSAMVYCASKLMEISHIFRIII